MSTVKINNALYRITERSDQKAIENGSNMRKLTSLFASVLMACAVSIGTEASAQTLIDATDPDEIRNLASGYGSAILTTDNIGEPMVSGRIDGTKYAIFFYGCKEAKDCKSIQFRASWGGSSKITPEAMSNWNREYRFGRAYTSLDGDPTIDWTVNLNGGVSRKNLDDTIDWWAIVLTDFEKTLME